ncbi:MAG: inositol monophosphatase [Candidatus Omnitrophica bacterium]|nr:inositol monophosphatase [Candidatus Omnitrophota bacterium]
MKLLDTAVQAAEKAGALLLSSYGRLKNSQIRVKTKNDFVTELDKASEELIIRTIRKSFPSSAFQAEESGNTAGGDLLWIIDPLDGTANYIHQFPLFAVSIAVMEKGVLNAGVIYDPLRKELFTAEKGKGARLNRKTIRVSPVARMADAMMATGIPFRARNRFKEYFASLETIAMNTAGMRRGGSAALDLAYLASGRFDGFWEINLSIWDIAAGDLLVREAGGEVTDLWGRDNHLKSGDVLATNGRIHPQIRAITSKMFTSKPLVSGTKKE